MIEVKNGAINLLEFLDALNVLHTKTNDIKSDISKLKDQRWELHRYVEKVVEEKISDKLQEIISFLKGE